MPTFSLASGLLTCMLTASPLGAEGSVPWAELAESFLSGCGFEEATPATADVETVLSSDCYVRAPMGLFDVRIPLAALADPKDAEKVIESVETVLAVERAWLQWTEPEALSDEANAQYKILSKWIGGVKPRAVAKIAGGTELFEALAPKERVLDALQYWRDLSNVHGEAPRNQVTRLILAADRRSLLEHNAYAGWVDPKRRSTAWADSMVGVNSAWIGLNQVIALEGSAYPVDLSRPFIGQSLSAYEKRGLAQHVADRTAHSLTRTIFYQYGIHFFESALADNLVIAACGRGPAGEFSFEYSWSQAGATTQAYTRFVPGGNPAGGVLPKRVAKAGPLITNSSSSGGSAYRSEGGENHFIAPLQAAQRAGAKLASKADDELPNKKHKLAHFALSSNSGGRQFVSAPFFGPSAEGKKLPGDEYLDDYEEFFRAYRACFFHWLRTGGKKKGKLDPERAAHFAQLIAAQGDRKPGEKLADRVEAIYGRPMSADSDEGDSLEWEFLTWLDKAKR